MFIRSVSVLVLLYGIGFSVVAGDKEQAEIKRLNAKVAALEKRVAELEELTRPLIAKQLKQKYEVANRRKYIAKNIQDKKKYTREQLQDIETLYQTANRNWNNPKARYMIVDTLEDLVKKYPDANRTGCAMLYLAQKSKNETEYVDRLKKVIDKYGNCWYGDGVQTGAYARLLLGYYYWKKGKKAEAEKLFNEIRKDYPGSLNHRGQLLTSIMPK